MGMEGGGSGMPVFTVEPSGGVAGPTELSETPGKEGAKLVNRCVQLPVIGLVVTPC